MTTVITSFEVLMRTHFLMFWCELTSWCFDANSLLEVLMQTVHGGMSDFFRSPSTLTQNLLSMTRLRDFRCHTIAAMRWVSLYIIFLQVMSSSRTNLYQACITKNKRHLERNIMIELRSGFRSKNAGRDWMSICLEKGKRRGSKRWISHFVDEWTYSVSS
jgi:hypothetical protein